MLLMFQDSDPVRCTSQGGMLVDYIHYPWGEMRDERVRQVNEQARREEHIM